MTAYEGECVCACAKGGGGLFHLNILSGITVYVKTLLI